MSNTQVSLDEEWLSIAQAAEKLASSRRVVTLWARNGKLGEVKPGQIGRGKGMRVCSTAVDARIVERTLELQKRVARDSGRQARLEQVHNGHIPAVVSQRSLTWMLDLLMTVSDIADETIDGAHASLEDARDIRKLMAGIGDASEALRRIRDRHFNGEDGARTAERDSDVA
jgi:hypothetical protein